MRGSRRPPAPLRRPSRAAWCALTARCYSPPPSSHAFGDWHAKVGRREPEGRCRVTLRFHSHLIDQRLAVPRDEWHKIEHSLLTLAVRIQRCRGGINVSHQFRLSPLHGSDIAALRSLDAMQQRSPQPLQRRGRNQFFTLPDLEPGPVATVLVTKSP